MVDPARLAGLLEAMAAELEILAMLGVRGGDELRSDPVAIRAVKYAFVVVIESAIDAAEHVIASEGLRMPASFADAFTVLYEAGLLEGELAAAMADAARFRNLLVHQYVDVDDDRVLEILRTRLDDLRAYRAAIAPLGADGESQDGESQDG